MSELSETLRLEALEREELHKQALHRCLRLAEIIDDDYSKGYHTSLTLLFSGTTDAKNHESMSSDWKQGFSDASNGFLHREANSRDIKLTLEELKPSKKAQRSSSFLHIRITDKEKQSIRDSAERLGLTDSELVRLAIKEKLSSMGV